MEEERNIPITRYIILDTNIFSKLEEDTEIGKQIIFYLQNLIKENPGWGLIISEFTLFETVNEMPLEKEIKMSNLLNNFYTYGVEKENLFIAGHLGCLYADYYKEIGITDKMPEPGDKIIAATSLRNDALIFTLNLRDFPAPFFSEIFRQVFTHDTKKGVAYTVAYMLKPEIQFFEDYFNKRITVKNPKKVSVEKIKKKVSKVKTINKSKKKASNKKTL